jgi:7,8-dihydropterin-6-yl-methyl-4-(beta-D-ribofuranosyl)aminobenzene 5'-phosphate synthase
MDARQTPRGAAQEMARPIRITILVENSAGGRGLQAEHGLSLWLEAGSERVLFDTGQTPGVLLHNARQLGIEIETADAVVLSHGHYDHTGGLREVLLRGGLPHIFLHSGALTSRYSRHRDGTVHEVGMPAAVDETFLRAHAASLTWTDGPTAVNDWLSVTGPVPRATDFEDTGGDFYMDAACVTPDPIMDDQAAFFHTPGGTVVLLGCGHAGVVNTLYHVRELTGGRPIRAVIGGLHLISASQQRLDATVDAFRSLGIALLAPAHCTGARAQARLGSDFPDRWEPCSTGTRLELGRSTAD